MSGKKIAIGTKPTAKPAPAPVGGTTASPAASVSRLAATTAPAVRRRGVTVRASRRR